MSRGERSWGHNSCVLSDAAWHDYRWSGRTDSSFVDFKSCIFISGKNEEGGKHALELFCIQLDSRERWVAVAVLGQKLRERFMEKKRGGSRFQRRTMLVNNKTLWFQKICAIILSITETTLRRNFQRGGGKAERRANAGGSKGFRSMAR